jgi:integrase
MSYIRDVGRWLQAHGNSDAYVLSDHWKAAFVRAHPYLLATREIERFFAAAARLEAQSPWRWQAVAFFTLMHSCGLRTGEPRLLRPDRVDLREGHIDVLWSKGNRSRRLPLTGEVIEVLAACDQTTRTQFGPARQRFFCSATGNQVTTATVGKIFTRIWDQAGLPRPIGGQQPRPYDLRHHFAYANIERWTARGMDVTAMLPYLARYMGHAGVESTYYYIHTSPDFMSAYADITSKTQSVLPEVGFESDATPKPATQTSSASPGTTCTPTYPRSSRARRRRSRPTGSAWSASWTTWPFTSTSNASTSALTTSTGST